MHKNGIKRSEGSIFLGILVEKFVIFPRFWAFWLVIFVTFYPKSRDFQEKSFGNTDQGYDFPHFISELLFPKKYQNVPQNCSRTFRVRSSTELPPLKKL